MTSTKQRADGRKEGENVPSNIHDGKRILSIENQNNKNRHFELAEKGMKLWEEEKKMKKKKIGKRKKLGEENKKVH